jgi:hypothetical protein
VLPGEHAGPLQHAQSPGPRARAHSACSAMRSYLGKQTPVRLLWKPHRSASRTSRKARVTGPRVGPGLGLRPPGARVGGNAGLGVADRRRDAAGLVPPPARDIFEQGDRQA